MFVISVITAFCLKAFPLNFYALERKEDIEEQTISQVNRTSEDTPKRLRPRPYASVRPAEWQEIGQKLQREKLPVGWEYGSRPDVAAAQKAPERKIHQDVYTVNGVKHIVTMPKAEIRVARVPVTTGAAVDVEHRISGLATAKPNQIAPCVPDITEPQHGLICGECETDVKVNGGEESRRVAKCETYPLDFGRCVIDLTEREGEKHDLSLKDKAEIALACSEKPLPPSVAAHAIDADRDDVYDVLDDLQAEGKVFKKRVEPDEMSFVGKDEPHPAFWFGEVKFYLDPARKKELRGQAIVF